MRRISKGWLALAAVATVSVPVAPAAAQATDTTAPSLAAATLDPAAFTGMRSPWYRGPIKVTISASDNVAVTRLQYSLDNGATWLDAAVSAGPSVTATVTITQEGSTTVRYRALDAAG